MKLNALIVITGVPVRIFLIQKVGNTGQIKYEFLDKKSGFPVARNDLGESCESIRWRYLMKGARNIKNKQAALLCAIVLCAPWCHSCAVSEKKLMSYSSECAEAERAYKTICNMALSKELFFVEYEGWIGDSRSFQLQHPVFMIIRFGGYGEGHYRLRKKESKRHDFTVKTDRENNIELKEKGEKGNAVYIFRGKEKNGTIKGVWRKSSGGEATAFYVTQTRRYGPLSRR